MELESSGEDHSFGVTLSFVLLFAAAYGCTFAHDESVREADMSRTATAQAVTVTAEAGATSTAFSHAVQTEAIRTLEQE